MKKKYDSWKFSFSSFKYYAVTTNLTLLEGFIKAYLPTTQCLFNCI